jgi:hypothetical protein
MSGCACCAAAAAPAGPLRVCAVTGASSCGCAAPIGGAAVAPSGRPFGAAPLITPPRAVGEARRAAGLCEPGSCGALLCAASLLRRCVTLFA